MDRFSVKNKNNIYYISDNLSKVYHMPDMAVSIYFKSLQRAQVICDIMNAEWQEFENNPE